MLYVREENGMYSPATDNMVFAEAHSISDAHLQRGEIITSSREAITAIAWKLRQSPVEVFACQFLDSEHRCLGFEEICTGTINVNYVHPREVVKVALGYNAAAVIFAHNHPSGNPAPSQQDIDLTKDFIKFLGPLRIQVLDHLIIGGHQVTSLADHGLI